MGITFLLYIYDFVSDLRNRFTICVNTGCGKLAIQRNSGKAAFYHIGRSFFSCRQTVVFPTPMVPPTKYNFFISKLLFHIQLHFVAKIAAGTVKTVSFLSRFTGG